MLKRNARVEYRGLGIEVRVQRRAVSRLGI